MNKPVALIVGAGRCISAAFGEALVAEGYRVALASRNVEKLKPLAAKINAAAFAADAASPKTLVQLFHYVDNQWASLRVVVLNSCGRIRGDLLF